MYKDQVSNPKKAVARPFVAGCAGTGAAAEEAQDGAGAAAEPRGAGGADAQGAGRGRGGAARARGGRRPHEGPRLSPVRISDHLGSLRSLGHLSVVYWAPQHTSNSSTIVCEVTWPPMRCNYMVKTSGARCHSTSILQRRSVHDACPATCNVMPAAYFCHAYRPLSAGLHVAGAPQWPAPSRSTR